VGKVVYVEENVPRQFALFFFGFFNGVRRIGYEIRVGHSCILFYRYLVHLRVADALKPENAAFGLGFKCCRCPHVSKNAFFVAGIFRSKNAGIFVRKMRAFSA